MRIAYRAAKADMVYRCEGWWYCAVQHQLIGLGKKDWGIRPLVAVTAFNFGLRVAAYLRIGSSNVQACGL